MACCGIHLYKHIPLTDINFGTMDGYDLFVSTTRNGGKLYTSTDGQNFSEHSVSFPINQYIQFMAFSTWSEESL